MRMRIALAVLIAYGMSLNMYAQQAQPSRTVEFTTLLNFDGTNGGNPTGPLVQGRDGDLYGITNAGGTGCPPYGGCGAFFKISPSGTLTVLYSFCPEGLPCPKTGLAPIGSLTLGPDGNFYGETSYGGTGIYPAGTVFKITPAGTLTSLYNWCSKPNCADGSEDAGQLLGPLIQASDGNLYGATRGGGVGTVGGLNGDGTIFRLTPTGELTTLHTFCLTQVQGVCTDGSQPSGLLQGADGDFYGTTYQGGANNFGTVFKITPKGILTTLYSFCSKGGSTCTDGGYPEGPLIQAANGNFYGTTIHRGDPLAACPDYETCGTVFEITPAGALTTIYDFCSLPNCEDGGAPGGQLVQTADGNFYGETVLGGPDGDGTLFKLTPAGVLTPLYSFDFTSLYLFDGLVQATNGAFYGMTPFGGIENSSLCLISSAGDTCGTVFRLSAGLRPFVKTLPVAGRPGSRVDILGTDIGDTISVSFDGKPATFKVISNTLVSAWVPNDASTGYVTLKLRCGETLKSNMKFQVLPDNRD